MTDKAQPYQFHDDCEKSVYINWLNINLYNNKNIGNHFPLNPHNEEIFDQISDGLIYCYTLNLIFPESIDITVVCQDKDMTNQEKLKNLQLAYETARSFGCSIVDIKLNHIFCGVRQSVLEFFWQIFYVGLVKTVNFLKHPDILLLRYEDESVDVVKTLKPEEILVRYVNYFIQQFNPGRYRFTSFKQDLNDGKMYVVLLDSISKLFGEGLKHCISTVFAEKDSKCRYDMLSENFNSLKIQGFLNENLMEAGCKDQACYKMHLLTVAVIFQKFPLAFEDSSDLKDLNDQILAEQETHLEVLCKAFINFLGVEPVCINLHHDCKDGILIAQAMNALQPDIFKKDKIIMELSKKQVASERIHNACICINKLGKFVSCPIPNLHPEYIQAGDRKTISNIIYNLMLYWICNNSKSEKSFNKKDLLNWVNSFDSNYGFNSFRDSQINEKNIFAKVIDNLFPQTIDWCYLDKLKTPKDRALYCISVARREGSPMFIDPSMLAVGDHQCIMLAFAILRSCQPKKENKCP